MTEPSSQFDPSRTPFGDVFDVEGLNDIFQGDTGLLSEMTQLFDAESTKLLGAIRTAIAAGDAHSIERAAHKLKGSIGSFCGRQSYQSALEMEDIGKSGNLAAATKAANQLDRDVQELSAALNAFLKV